MLVLSRRPGEAILVGDNIEIRLLSIRGGAVPVGINAPKDVKVLREELLDKVKKERVA